MARAERWKPVHDSAGIIDSSGRLFGPGQFHDSVSRLFSAATNEEQARLLRSLSSSLPDVGFLIVLATHVLFAAELKSPARGAAVRVLLSLPGDAVVERLATAIRDRLAKVSTEEDVASLAMLTGMFENFPPGVAAVDSCLPQVLGFVHAALRRAVADLPAPCAVKTAHASCRLVVLVLQKCSLRRNQCGAHFQSTLSQESLPEELTALLPLVSALTAQPGVAMETCANAALAAVLLVAQTRGLHAAIELSSVSESSKDVGLPGLDLGDDKCRLHLTTATMTQRWARPHRHSLLEQLLDLAERNAADGGFQLSAARTVHQHLRCPGDRPADPDDRLSNREDLLPDRENPVPDRLMDRVTRSVLSWLQHPGDSVRHAARDGLEALLGNLDAERQAALLASVSGLPWRPRLVAVETVTRCVGGHALLVAMPTLPDDLRRAMLDPQLGKNASAAYERLLVDAHSWTQPCDWLARWVEPALSANHGSARTVALSAAAKLEPAWFARTATDGQTDVQVALCCAVIGHRLGLGSAPSDQTDQSDEPATWRGLVTTATMEAALGHRDHQTRLQALWLLAGDRNAASPPTAHDLRLFRAGVANGACADDEAARLEALAALKRCLRRITDCAGGLHRDRKLELAAAHAAFLRWLAQWCQRSLFPGANFARRAFAVATLEQLALTEALTTEVAPKERALNVAALKEAVPKEETLKEAALEEMALKEGTMEEVKEAPPMPVPFAVAQLVSPGVLVAALRDPFEGNRTAARSLLRRFSLEQLGLADADAMTELVHRSVSLAQSTRPPDPPVAAHLLRLLASFDQSAVAFGAGHQSQGQGEAASSPHLLAVRLLADRLGAQIAVAQRSLLAAAATAPMHGTAHCVRAMLQDVPLESLGGDAAWGCVVGRLISCCEDMLEAAGPLCSSCSPEGLLPPEDLQSDGASYPGADAAVPVATAQMALICAWRSVKDSALLLGNLAEWLSVATVAGDDGLMTEATLDRIAERLLRLLQETRHRGAFEQAQVAVTQAARRLWGRSSSKPALWLEDVLREIAVGSDLCETRRGAGLPLLVTALLGSQPGHQRALPVAVRLLEIAGQGSGAQTANRVAALNVLRAAFRDSALGATLTPLLSVAVETAMAATAVPGWPERSAGTLLFAALATRLLGVESSAGQRSSAPALIQRHPALAPALATAMAGSEPARLPALTLLAKLSPATTDESSELRTLAALVESCAASRGLHLRWLAALALSALVPRQRRPDALALTLRRLEAANGANERHGNLLMVERLLTPPPSPAAVALTTDCLCRLGPSLVAAGNGPVLVAWTRCVDRAVATETVTEPGLAQIRRELRRCENVRVRYGIGQELLEESVAKAMLSVTSALATASDDPLATHGAVATANSPATTSYNTIESLAEMSLTDEPLQTDPTSTLSPSEPDEQWCSPGYTQHCTTANESLATLCARLLSRPATRSAALSFLKAAPAVLLEDSEVRQALHSALDAGENEAQLLDLCCDHPSLLRPSDWHRALLLADSDSEPRRCAAIGCLAWLLPPTEGAWGRLVAALEAGAGEERSTACHLQVAKAVSRLISKPEMDAVSAVTWLRLHTLLVQLMQHCEPSVRDAATPPRDCPREPHGALSATLSALSAHKHGAVALVAWSWRRLMEDTWLSLQTCPFDRGEPNGFSEPGLVAELCCDWLSRLGPAAWTNHVPGDVMQWVAEHVGVGTGGTAGTLGEFVVSVRNKTRQLQGCDWGKVDWERFFAPDFAPSRAAAYRRQLVLDVAEGQC